MLTDNDIKTVQKIAAREVMLIAAKLEDYNSDPDSEFRQVARMLRHFASERFSEADTGVNFMHYNQPQE